MATIATVGFNGELVLPAEIQRTLGIAPGSRVEIAVHGHHLEITPKEQTPIENEHFLERKISAPILAHPVNIPAHIDRMIRETRGMFAGNGGGMAEDLQAQRRKDERRFQEKW